MFRISPTIKPFKPTVSLESTIITHGLPYPHNLEMARSVENNIRKSGAVPATCAFLNGIAHVGLDDDQLKQLATAKDALKVSRRDIGHVMASGRTGGTTIAATMILSEMAGIRVFATGGLGGVHRDAQATWDVSADLTELGRTPVAVVCAGPKSILDIGLTMEYLETQGVFVSTYDEYGRGKVDVPGFYCRESGVASPNSFMSFGQVARAIHCHNDVMGLRSGSVVCVPPPQEYAMDSREINAIVGAATGEAGRRGIGGKELTPYLLGRIGEETGGRSVECNVRFVENNVRVGVEIAKELEHLKRASKNSFQPFIKEESKQNREIIESKENSKETRGNNNDVEKDGVLFIGSVAVDTICTIENTTKHGDSNPGTIQTSIGGVGHNIALAAHYARPGKAHLVSVVGNDSAGQLVLDQVKKNGLDVSGIARVPGRTPQYCATHTRGGDLVVAVADMGLVEKRAFSEHILQQVQAHQPQRVVFDCNVSVEVLSEVLQGVKGTDVIIDPTSYAKASRIIQSGSGIFPNNAIQLVAPTLAELDQMYTCAQKNGLFDDYDVWFPALDSLGINKAFRDRLDVEGRRNPVVKELLDKGALQQAFHLIPFFQNILIKVGDQGVVWVSICTNVNDIKSIPTASKYKPQTIVNSTGGSNIGVVVEHFAIPPENRNLAIKNVTGAGDSLLGYLAAVNDWYGPEITSVEQVWRRWESVYKGQLASGRSLEYEGAISGEIKRIK